jgi:hypothetical protein
MPDEVPVLIGGEVATTLSSMGRLFKTLWEI